MKKLLFISNISNEITNFAIPSIRAAQELGYEVHMAANYTGFKDDPSKYNVRLHHIDLERNPFKLKNIKAYKQMLSLIKKEKFEVIHCNTPIGGILGRICGRKNKVNKIIYTVHGFHFYKGAPFINNILYKNVEKYLAKKTDAIITINQEDYNNALEFKKVNSNLKIFYVPGVGINRDKIINVLCKREELCEELRIHKDSFLIISAGELNFNKNHRVVIEAISKMVEKDNVHYILCGVGKLEKKLRELAVERGISNRVHFLGYRKDVIALMKSSNLFIMPSYREGLSRAIMEAMASGLPVIASKARGNSDLIEEEKGGYLCTANDSEAFRKNIEKIIDNSKKTEEMGKYNFCKSEKFDVANINCEILKIYKEVII